MKPLQISLKKKERRQNYFFLTEGKPRKRRVSQNRRPGFVDIFHVSHLRKHCFLAMFLKGVRNQETLFPEQVPNSFGKLINIAGETYFNFRPSQETFLQKQDCFQGSKNVP